MGDLSPETTAILQAIQAELRKEGKPSEEEEKTTLNTVSKMIVNVLKAEALTIYKICRKENIFHFIYYSPTLTRTPFPNSSLVAVLQEKLLGYRLPEGMGIVGQVIETGQPDVFKKAPEDKRMLDLSEYTGFSVHSMMTFPITARETLGAIQILNKKTTHAFVETDVVFMNRLMEPLSFYLSKAWVDDFVLTEEERKMLYCEHA